MDGGVDEVDGEGCAVEADAAVDVEGCATVGETVVVARVAGCPPPHAAKTHISPAAALAARLHQGRPLMATPTRPPGGNRLRLNHSRIASDSSAVIPPENGPRGARSGVPARMVEGARAEAKRIEGCVCSFRALHRMARRYVRRPPLRKWLMKRASDVGS
jgi:hypothetical protein